MSGFYGGFEAAELEAIAVAGTLEGVDAELTLLRVLIRRCVELGDVAEARRGIADLGRLVALRAKLSAEQEGELSSNLGRVLDTLQAEMEDGG